MTRLFIIFILFCAAGALFSCDSSEPGTPTTTSYAWTESSLSPTTDLTIFRLKKSQDGELYFSAWGADEKTVFAKRVGTAWEILAEPGEQVIGDFAVFQDTVYYSTALQVKKTRNSYVAPVLTTTVHSALEVYDDKLFIAGAHLPYNGDEYSVLSYNTARQFSPVHAGISHSRMKIVNGKLFISGQSVVIYAEGMVTETTYTKDVWNVDDEESFYRVEKEDAGSVSVERFRNQRTEPVGNTIPTDVDITRLEFAGGSVIITGHKPSVDESSTFILNPGGRWLSIDTDFIIYDIVNFNGILLAGSDGKIMELVERF